MEETRAFVAQEMKGHSMDPGLTRSARIVGLHGKASKLGAWWWTNLLTRPVASTGVSVVCYGALLALASPMAQAGALYGGTELGFDQVHFRKSLQITRDDGSVIYDK